MTAPGWLLGQTFSLPLDIADSALYLIKKGKACETLIQTQALELRAADSVIHQGKRITVLQDQQIANLNTHNLILKRELSDSRLVWEDQRKKYRQRIRRQRLAIIGVSALGVLLAVL